VQRPEIGAAGQKRVGAARLFHREIGRRGRDAFEFRSEPRDTIEIKAGQPLGRDGAASDPAGQAGHGCETDILRGVWQAAGTGRDRDPGRGGRQYETGQARVEPGRGGEIEGQGRRAAPFRELDLAREVVEHEGPLGLGVAYAQDILGRRDGLCAEH